MLKESASLTRERAQALKVAMAELEGRGEALQQYVVKVYECGPQLFDHRVARSLAAVVNLLDPEAIVLGGGLSNISQLYDGLTEHVGRYAFSDYSLATATSG